MSREDWEVFDLLREERKLEKARYRQVWEARFMNDELPGKWRKCCETHWQTALKGDLLDYWPGTRRFRWRGKSHTGDVVAFIKKETDQ